MQQSEVTTLRSRPQIVHPFLSDGHECKKSQCKGAGAFLPSTHTPEGAELIDSVLDVVRKEAEGEDLTPGLSFVDSPFLINQHRSLEPRKRSKRSPLLCFAFCRLRLPPGLSALPLPRWRNRRWHGHSAHLQGGS